MSDANKTPPDPDANGHQGPWEDDQLQSEHERLMQDKKSPAEGFSLLPIGLLFVFCGLVFWGGVYLANNSGFFYPEASDPQWKPSLVKTETVAFDPIQRGKKVFKKNCQQCHQASGQGIPGVYPPLVDSRWVEGDLALSIKIILLGIEGPITVKGVEYNNAMTNFSNLSDRDIAAVVTYIRQAWGNEAASVEEAKVTEIRTQLGGRTTPWTADELLKQHPLD